MVDLGSTVKPIKEICSWQKRHFIQYNGMVHIIYRVLFRRFGQNLVVDISYGYTIILVPLHKLLCNEGQ